MPQAPGTKLTSYLQWPDVSRMLGLESGGEAVDDSTPGNCQDNRPALVPRVKCPGVGPQVAKMKLDDPHMVVCTPQPPACCGSAKRAEWATQQLQNLIMANPVLRMLQMSSVSQHTLAVAAMAPQFPSEGRKKERSIPKVARRQDRGNASLAKFL
eukprot:TRINITY_DN40820_c0_g1_i1.p1 TRINITY_DN40820_c0_g1~~TRINITY_DN40820_c0_g1_i1.p1  ORF type:complete len:155 (+),score=29.27 TRINITY_DN40820_c0_g1_i1:90-554(+)